MRILNSTRQLFLSSCLLFGLGSNAMAAHEPEVGQQPAPAQGGSQQRVDSSQQKIQGDWEATLDAGTIKLRLILHIVKTDGGLKATLDVPEQGATGLGLDGFSVNDGAVHFELKANGAVYDGKLSKDETKIEGDLTQGPTFPLVFSRAGKTEAAENPLKLQKVDAGGHSLNFLVGGKRSTDQAPAIILEGGFGAGIASWSTVQGEIAKFAQVASYDRAGLSQSEPGPKPRSAKQIALELHAALKAAGIKPPYVLVGHSMGGPYVRVFADMYPSEIAGMVLIDPSQEAFEDWVKTRPEYKADQAKLKELLTQATQGVRDEGAAIDTTYEQVRAAKMPPGIPVILLTAMLDPAMPVENRRFWEQKHQEWIETIPGAKHIRAEKSRHFIQVDDPKLVIDAIREVIDKAQGTRSKNP